MPLTVSFADRRDETAPTSTRVCPDHHFLESWGDAEPVSGHFSLRQPLIAPLHDTRAGAESLLRWLRASRPDATTPTCATSGGATLYPARGGRGGELRRLLGPDARARRRRAARTGGGGRAAFARRLAGGGREHRRARAPARRRRTAATSWRCYETVGARDGRHANNPWLQELPDPITRLTWGNVACIAPATAAALRRRAPATSWR